MPHALSPSPERDAAEDIENVPPPVERSPLPKDEMESSQDTDVVMKDEDSQDTTVKQEIQEQPRSLEDMFDDDSDDEFSSSADVKKEEPIIEYSKPSKPKYCEPDILRQYYGRLLPFRQLFQWLNHSATPQLDFQHREFAFTLPNGGYLRYQSFQTADLFKKACMDLAPERFEIGPQYTINPRDRKSLRKASAFKPIMKELVFDIDMTDYDDVRTCCSKANICNKCWKFIVMAIRVVDTALRDDFGFQHILWVYSGRRGAHAWISDKRAREMDDGKRKAIANYLGISFGGDHGKKMGIKRPLHPHLDRSLKILNPYFQNEILGEQDPWEETERSAKLLKLLPDATLTAALQKKWDSMPGRSSSQKWGDIDSVAEAGNLSTLSTKQLVESKQDIRLEYMYPRLDAEVSKKLNHLLKSPFVIHPGTGRVCVPIDVRNLESFDPLTVPTVLDLLAEIDAWDKSHQDMGEDERKQVQEWQKTSLKPYVEYFRGHVSNLLREEGRGKRGREDEGESMEF